MTEPVVQGATEQPLLSLQQLAFRWPGQGRDTLQIEQFQVQPGERLFIKGPSGSGKTTLLSLLGGINIAGSGTVSLLGQPLEKLSASQRDHFRSCHIGFIFQQFNLLPYLSITDNVLLPCRFSKERRQRAEKLAEGGLESLAHSLLQELKLPQELWHKPVTALSVGQQQRVAAARALIGNPELIIADEPTSALDADSREAFIRLLFSECERHNSTLLFVSHDGALAPLFDRSVSMNDLNRLAQPAEVLA